MITLSFQGGLGNQLWQYAVGRILSRKLGLLFVSNGVSGLTNCPRIIGGKLKMKEKIEIHGHLLPSNLRRQRIHLDGYFERYEYVSPFMDELRSWYQPTLKNRDVDPNALTISIRRGSNNWPVETLCPDKEYYLEKISRLGFTKHYICTDSPDDEFIQDLSNEFPKCVVIRSSPLDQFSFIQNSKNVFLAPSTFSWWAAMTGEAEQIFWPQIPALDFEKTDYDWFPEGDKRIVLI